MESNTDESAALSPSANQPEIRGMDTDIENATHQNNFSEGSKQTSPIITASSGSTAPTNEESQTSSFIAVTAHDQMQATQKPPYHRNQTSKDDQSFYHYTDSLNIVTIKNCVTDRTILYNTIRSGDVNSFGSLVNEWEENCKGLQFHILLSEVYEELKLKNVELSEHMEFAVEKKLIDDIFFDDAVLENVTAVSDPLGNVMDRIRMICELTNELHLKHIQTVSGEQRLSTISLRDEEFLLIARFIAQSVHILKHQLRATYSKLPWEEIEFCIAIFILSHARKQKFNLVYKIILYKDRLVRHVQNFATSLNAIKSEISLADIGSNLPMHKDKSWLNQNELMQAVNSRWTLPTGESLFQELYNDHEKVRTTYSLKRIESYIKLALSVDLKKNEMLGKLVIERVLQVVGESLKSSVQSPNVSEEIQKMLLYSGTSNNVGEIVTHLRDDLSHAKSLDEQMKLENIGYANFFGSIQNDLKKLEDEICEVLYREKTNALKLFYQKLIDCKDLAEVKKIFSDLHQTKLGNLYLEKDNQKELDALKKLIHELGNDSERWTSEEKDLYNKIIKILDAEKTKLKDIKTNFITNFAKTNRLLTEISDCQSLETIHNSCKDYLKIISFQMSPGKLSDVAHLATVLGESMLGREPETNTDKLCFIFSKIGTIIRYEAQKIAGINEFRERLERKQEAKSQLSALKEIECVLNDVAVTLTNEKTLNSFLQALVKTRTAYEAKIKLESLYTQLIEGETTKEEVSEQIELFINLLDLKKRQKIAASDWVARKKWICSMRNKFLTLLNSVRNCTDNETSGDISKPFKEFITSLIADRVQCDEICKALDKTLESVAKKRKIRLEICFNNRLEALKDLVLRRDDNNDFIRMFCHNEELRAAVEVLVLDLTKILGDQFQLADSKMFIDNYSPVMTGISLRNYLAHGNLLFDILPNSPSRAILINALKFASMPSLNNRVIGEQVVENVFGLMERYRNNLNSVANQNKMFSAARDGNVELIQCCVSEGADLYGRNSRLWTGLHFATVGDSVENVDFFHNQNISLDLKDLHGNSPLQIAATAGSSKVLRFFLEGKHLDVNIVANGYNKKSLLHEAAKRGHKETVKVLLDNGANVNALAMDNWTPLHAATLQGCTDITQALFDKGADILALLEDGATLLHLAAQNGHHCLAKFLLENGLLVSVPDNNGVTPLHVAAYCNHLNVVHVLLEANGALDAKDNNDWTPLFMAATAGCTNVVNFLLQKGAACDARNNNGWTPLHMAVLQSNMDVVRLILQNNACTVNAAETKGNTALHFAASSGFHAAAEILLKKGARVDATNEMKWTPLHWAAGLGNTEVVKVLMKYSATVDACSRGGETPLVFASKNGFADVVDILCTNGAEIDFVCNSNSLLQWASQNGHRDVAEVLLAHGASVDIQNNNANKRWPPLHAATHQGHLDVVQLLLEKGAEVDLLNDLEWTALHWAATRGYSRIATLLLEKGANKNLKNIHGDAPLHYAAHSGHDDVVKVLIKHNADANATNKDGWTPLHWAAAEGHIKVTNVLLKSNVNVNALGENNEMPIHFATQNGHADVVRALLAKDADITAHEDGLYLLHWAAERGHREVIEALLEKGCDINVASLDEYARTPLHLASCEGFVDVAHVLLKNGALSDVLDKTKMSPLYLASRNGHQGVVRLLIGDGGDIAVLDKNNCLCLAAASGHHDVVKLLLDCGASVNYQNNGNLTALHLAVHNGQIETAKLLLRHDADVQIKNIRGMTALHYSAKGGDLEFVKLLIDNNAAASINVRDNNGCTPLDLAKTKLTEDEQHLQDTNDIVKLLESLSDANKTSPSNSVQYHS